MARILFLLPEKSPTSIKASVFSQPTTTPSAQLCTYMGHFQLDGIEVRLLTFFKKNCPIPFHACLTSGLTSATKH